MSWLEIKLLVQELRKELGLPVNVSDTQKSLIFEINLDLFIHFYEVYFNF